MTSTFRSQWPQPGTLISLSHAPEFFDATSAQDRDKLEAFVASGSVTTIHDSIHDQLEELIEVRSPHLRVKGEALYQLVLQYLNGTPIDHYGTYVFFPWRKELLHILPKDEFVEVRTSRNKYRITPAEQVRLSSMKIGIIGLSVGAATALTLALEGIGGELRIADFDTLSLSNTNRLRSPISNIGVNKAVLCAREILEINPYLKIRVFPSGLSEENFSSFMLGDGDDGKLDLLIEECDDLPMKVYSREQARHHGVPVIMETSDKGMLDVERFDEDRDRPLFHGLMGDMNADRLKILSPKERMQYQVRIVGTRDSVSPRLLAGLFEMGRTARSWPQLASAISLGAGVAADTARRILLGEAIPSGRFYVDLTKLVSAEASAELPNWDILDSSEIVSQLSTTSPIAVPSPPIEPLAGSLTPTEASYIVAHGCLAPSGGNAQAWAFTLRSGRIDCSIPSSYKRTNLDWGDRSLYLAMGAAVQNILLASLSIGLQGSVLPATKTNSRDVEVCSIEFERIVPVQERLFEAVPNRITNRQQSDQITLLTEAKFQALIKVAEKWGARLRIVTSEEQKWKIANVIGTVDRIRFLNPGLHADLCTELQWARDGAHKMRTGIGIDTLGFDNADKVGAYIMTSWPVMKILRDLNLGSDLKRMGTSTKCSAYALLTIPKSNQDQTLQSYLEGGRAMQEIWLEATLQNLGFWPSSSAPFMFARLEQGGGDIYDEREKETLREARKEFLEVFESADRECEVLLFKLSDGVEKAERRSLRVGVEQVLRFED